jgi:hypothetical protein
MAALMHNLVTTSVVGVTPFSFNPQRKKLSIPIKQETGSGGCREEKRLLPLASQRIFWFFTPQHCRLQKIKRQEIGVVSSSVKYI